MCKFNKLKIYLILSHINSIKLNCVNDITMIKDVSVDWWELYEGMDMKWDYECGDFARVEWSMMIFNKCDGSLSSAFPVFFCVRFPW